MDLRRRIVSGLALGFAALFAVLSACWLFGLRQDARQELEAAERLTALMLAVSQAQQGLARGEREAEALAPVQTLIAAAGLRHVAVSLQAPGGRADAPAGPPLLAAWLLGTRASPAEQRIALGTHTLVIRPEPQSEISEQLFETARVLLTLFCFATLAVVAGWLAVDRALAPARELEAAVARLERDEPGPLPERFELAEFARIGASLQNLAAHLTQARSAERALTQRLLSVQEAERSELARELHDQLGQELTAIAVAGAYVERHAGSAPTEAVRDCAREIVAAARQVSAQVRDMLARLRPHGLEGLSLDLAMRELVEGWRKRAPGVDFQLRLAPLPALSQPGAVALYRALQEAITNSLRHAGARRVWVSCLQARDAAEVELVVCDDGAGHAEQVWARRGGGLRGMQERLAMAGGRLALSDRRCGGLMLCARVPLPPAQAQSVCGTDHAVSAQALEEGVETRDGPGFSCTHKPIELESA